MQNCPSRSIPEIHSHVTGMLSNQPTNKHPSCRGSDVLIHSQCCCPACIASSASVWWLAVEPSSSASGVWIFGLYTKIPIVLCLDPADWAKLEKDTVSVVCVPKWRNPFHSRFAAQTLQMGFSLRRKCKHEQTGGKQNSIKQQGKRKDLAAQWYKAKENNGCRKKKKHLSSVHTNLPVSLGRCLFLE